MRAPAISGLSRRTSLLTLGAPGIAALAPRPAVAKKRANSRCKKQVGQSRTSITAVCSHANCAAAIACCDRLASCNFSDFATCAIAATAGPNGN